MGDEAQRYIREARARALNRLARLDEPPGEAACPCPVSSSSSLGAIRRQPLPTRAPTTPTPRRYEPPVQQLLSVSPDRGPDPQAMAHLSRVMELSQCPVPQPRAAPTYSQNLPTWDYQYEGGEQGGYEDPRRWESVQSFDPLACEGASGSEPEGSTSYYDMLSEMREPGIDLSGGVEDILGRAQHRAKLAAGYRKDVPLYPTPCRPGTAVESDDYLTEDEGPSLDDILAGAPQLPPTDSEIDLQEELGMYESEGEDEYSDLLPSDAIESLGDDFPIQTAQEIKTDAFGLPFRRYPNAEKAQRERLRCQQAEAVRRQQEAARAQAEAQQRAAEEAAMRQAEAEAAARAAARPARAGPSRPSSGRNSACPRASTPSRNPVPTRTTASTRAPACPRATAGPSRAASTTPNRPSSRGACPAPTRKTPADCAAEEKAAKTAALLAATKKRTQYQAPKLKSRPPPKPPTKPKAPRCLEKRGDREGPDPTRDMMYYSDYGLVEPEPIWDIPEPRMCPGGPVEMPTKQTYQCPEVPSGLLEEVTGIIAQTRNSLIETINKYR